MSFLYYYRNVTMNNYWILVFAFALNSCSGQRNLNESQVELISYTASTRGSTYSCYIDKKEILVAEDGQEEKNKKRDLKEKEWESCVQLIAILDLDRIDELEVKSKDRFLDRARIASVMIRAKNRTYQSISFDEGNPPKELKPLVNKILALAETVE